MQNLNSSTTETYKNYFKTERFVKFIILSFVTLISCSMFMSHSIGSFSFLDWLVVVSQKSNVTQIICGLIAYTIIPMGLSYLIIYRRKNSQANAWFFFIL